MEHLTDTLPNGMRIIHIPNNSPISYCGIMINSGSRDEFDNESGIAHFTEHMLFKGTHKRRPHHILDRMESVGGELNAFTSKEETVVYSIFFEEYLQRSIELLDDMIFNSQFSDKQIERERIVILDEINSYLDTPSALIYDEFEQVLFDKHELGNPILGTPKSLMNITSKAMKEYVNRQFKPDRMVFFSMGKTPFDKVIKLAHKYFSVHNAALSTPQPKKRIAPSITTPNNITVKKDTHQTHFVLGRKTINMYQPDRIALYLLNSILGGMGMNSRLNTSLREKNGLVYTVESTHALYTNSGVFSIYFGCDPNNTNKCLNLIHKELHKLSHIPLTPHQLSKAKKQLTGELGIAAENKESLILDIAKSYLHLNRSVNLTELLHKIKNTTAEEIQEVAKSLFTIEEFSSIQYSH
ncbi:MAG: pitrilysin family protein [Dysgonamonadaceae bacterium]|nr:pitrilysin family protein [Dysgonamonadaceae bacterium]